MSADNYNLITADGDKFVVAMGFASDDEPPTIQDHHPRFSTVIEAIEFANSDYTEYGTQFSESALALSEQKKNA